MLSTAELEPQGRDWGGRHPGGGEGSLLTGEADLIPHGPHGPDLLGEAAVEDPGPPLLPEVVGLRVEPAERDRVDPQSTKGLKVGPK